MKTKHRNIALGAIFLLGSLQMVGHLANSRTIRGLGLATGIAPYPKVFCEAEGYEPFAATFEIQGEDSSGETISIPLDPERYSQLSGPYNRRNVYGAALAYAPRLPKNLRTHLFSEVLRDTSPLPKELDLTDLESPRILIHPRQGEDTELYQYSLKPLTSH